MIELDRRSQDEFTAPRCRTIGPPPAALLDRRLQASSRGGDQVAALSVSCYRSRWPRDAAVCVLLSHRRREARTRAYGGARVCKARSQRTASLSREACQT